MRHAAEGRRRVWGPRFYLLHALHCYLDHGSKKRNSAEFITGLLAGGFGVAGEEKCSPLRSCALKVPSKY